MERLTWRDGKVRLRLNYEDLSELGLDPERIARWDNEAEGALRRFITELQRRGEVPAGELFAEVFPGKNGFVLQIGPVETDLCYYLKSTDEMLTVYRLAKARGAGLFQRLDGKGYYLTTENAAAFSEFARPCAVSVGFLSERCRRIL